MTCFPSLSCEDLPPGTMGGATSFLPSQDPQVGDTAIPPSRGILKYHIALCSLFPALLLPPTLAPTLLLSSLDFFASSFSSGADAGLGFRSVSTSTTFVNGRRITTKR